MGMTLCDDDFQALFRYDVDVHVYGFVALVVSGSKSL
jgi:hypothetical protein